jgi:hypothetical protein
MPEYDFHTLNHKEFEDLVRDLLQEEWNCMIESFKTGRDTGIDLRYCTSNLDSEATIIQAKHWIRSSVSQLIAHLTKVELVKVRKLQPKRYVVATSLSLTAKNKKSLTKAFNGYIHRPTDVIDGEMLNALLLKYPNIEKKHYKLWLTSVGVMQAILRNAVNGRSLFAEEMIRSRISMFVQTEAYNRAKAILNTQHAIVIKGEPGAGKTVMAQMLVYEHLANGFQLVVVNETIRDAEEMWVPDMEQIFYFDDFLGSNYLEVLTATNTDTSICAFFERVRGSKKKRLIMTSRTTILNKALSISDKFQTQAIGANAYEVNAVGYSSREKAKILYNHICSLMPYDYYHKLYEEKYYWDVVVHKNYSPRLIEYVTKPILMREISPEGYKDYIKTALDNPSMIWKHPYEMQTDDYEKMLLITLFTLPYPVESAVLKYAYLNRVEYEVQFGGHKRIPNPFYSKVRELQDGFIRHIRDTNREYYQFYNPSIIDYLVSYLSEDDTEIERVFSSIVYYDQLVHRFGSTKPIKLNEEISARILSIVRANSEKYRDRDGRSSAIPMAFAYIELFDLNEVAEDVVILMPDAVNDDPDYSNMAMLLRILKVARGHEVLSSKVKEVWNSTIDWLVEATSDRDDFEEILSLFELYDMKYSEYFNSRRRHVAENVDRVIDFMIGDYVLSGSEIDNITDMEKMRSYIYSAEEEYAAFRLLVVPDEEKQIPIMLEYEIEEKVNANIESAEEGEYRAELWRDERILEDVSDKVFVDDLFDSFIQQ